MTNLDPFKLIFHKAEECACCHRTLEIETEAFDSTLGGCAAEIYYEHEAALERAGWANGYCDTCVSRGFGKD
jgi:hypothetical protein